jgi:hypothetical protein
LNNNGAYFGGIGRMKLNKSLAEWQKDKLLSILPLGCDRATACKYVGATLAQFQAEIKRDPDFAQAVARAEAEVDLRHLGNVQKASRDEKNWRTSVWWLERRARERSADAKALSEVDLIELLDEVARAITAEIQDEELQRRVIERLLESLAKREELAAISLAVDQTTSTDSAEIFDPTSAQKSQ